MQSMYLQRIMKKNAAKRYKKNKAKTNPIKLSLAQLALSAVERVEWTQFVRKPKNEHKLNFEKGLRDRLANLAGFAGIAPIGSGKNSLRGSPCGLSPNWLKKMPKKILDLGSKVMYNPPEILAHKPLRDLAFPSPSAAQGLFYGKFPLCRTLGRKSDWMAVDLLRRRCFCCRTRDALTQ